LIVRVLVRAVEETLREEKKEKKEKKKTRARKLVRRGSFPSKTVRFLPLALLPLPAPPAHPGRARASTSSMKSAASSTNVLVASYGMAC
jgi:hypothetical protein